MSATLLAALAAGNGSTQVDSTGEVVLFWILAPLMVVSALGLVFARKAVHAALATAVVMVNLGIVYLAQDAPFLGVVQVFVYTGAVMMLFLFVLMLVGVDSSDSLVETIKGQRVAAVLLGLGFGALLMSILSRPSYDAPTGLAAVNVDGNITALARQIFGPQVWAFEVTSALLITAALGAMVLAHRERTEPKPTQRELSEQRIRSGVVKAPLPAPGVYARHNAVDTPALLPDGSQSELSVSRVLTARGQMRPVSSRAGEVSAVLAELDHPLDSAVAVDLAVDPAGDPLDGPAGDGTSAEGER